MRDRGDDLSRPTEIEFYFYVPPMASNRVASDVRGMGFHAEIRETISDGGAYNGDTLVYVSTHHVVSLAYLNRVDRSFKAEAKRYGGTYDGWEAVDPVLWARNRRADKSEGKLIWAILEKAVMSYDMTAWTRGY